MINWVVDYVTRILAEHFQNEPGSDHQNWSSELIVRIIWQKILGHVTGHVTMVYTGPTHKNLFLNFLNFLSVRAI